MFSKIKQRIRRTKNDIRLELVSDTTFYTQTDFGQSTGLETLTQKTFTSIIIVYVIMQNV